MNRILIVGAGYAGTVTAVQLNRKSEPFTLVNKYPYHYFTTLLHEAAGGRAKPEKYSITLQALLHKPSSHLVVDEVVRIDRERKCVVTRNGEHSYDWMVYALGWIPEYFGIPGLAEHSLGIRDLASAAHIRQHIEQQFAEYVSDRDPRHLRVVVGGAGLTGVELCGELLDWMPELCVHYGIDNSLIDLQNIEAMPGILPQVSESLRETAARVLADKGATIRTNTKVVKVEAGVMYVEGSDPIEAGTIIWTGGVRANPLLTDAGFTVDRRGRAKVNEFLQSADDEHIFIGGDSAWFEPEEGKPLPPTAQIATQMGYTLAANVSAAAHGRHLKPFRAHLQGTLASLGREIGVGDMMGMPVHGVVAGLAKEATKVKYLWQLGGAPLTIDKTGDIVHL